MGVSLPEKPDDREGAEGLAQVIEGKADDGMIFPVFEKRREARAEIWVEDIFFGMLGGVQQIAAFYGDEAVVAVVGEAEMRAFRGRPFDDPVHLGNRPSVPGAIRVPLPVPEQGEVCREMEKARLVQVSDTESASMLPKQPEHGFEICIQERVTDPVGGEGPGERRQPGGGFGRLDNGWVDEDHEQSS